MKPRSYKQATKMMIPRWKAIANADSLGTMLDIYSSDDDALCVLQESKGYIIGGNFTEPESEKKLGCGNCPLNDNIPNETCCWEMLYWLNDIKADYIDGARKWANKIVARLEKIANK